MANSSPNPPYRLLAPGPVPIPRTVREALSHPVLHHRTPEFELVLKRVWAGLKVFFATQQPVLLHASTGSGAMESAVVNLLKPGDEVLCIVAGKFGERWSEICNTYGMGVTRLDVPWGQAVDLKSVRQILKSNQLLKAVFCQACETSTATQQPIQALSQLIHAESQALLVVDAITALGCMPLPMDEWQIDVLVAGSQKALMLPTGLSLISLSAQAWSLCEKNPQPRYYFDLRRELAANLKGQTFFSTPGHHVVALDVVLTELRRVGIERVMSRCQALAEATRQAGQALGLSVYSQAPAAAVTALRVPEHVDGEKLRDLLEAKHRITIMGGQDQLRGKILRIGHMGDISDDDMRALLTALAASLDDLSNKNGLFNNKLPEALNVLRACLAAAPQVFS